MVLGLVTSGLQPCDSRQHFWWEVRKGWMADYFRGRVTHDTVINTSG